MMITETAHTLVADLIDDDEVIRLEVEVPGIEHIVLEVPASGHTVTVSGRRPSHYAGRYLLMERGTTFSRSFDLPDNADMWNLHARIRDGVLTISAPVGEGRPALGRKRIDVQPSIFACHPDAAPI
jgi:HSP20 family molecular chaperone IbpA